MISTILKPWLCWEKYGCVDCDHDSEFGSQQQLFVTSVWSPGTAHSCWSGGGALVSPGCEGRAGAGSTYPSVKGSIIGQQWRLTKRHHSFKTFVMDNFDKDLTFKWVLEMKCKNGIINWIIVYWFWGRLSLRWTWPRVRGYEGDQCLAPVASVSGSQGPLTAVNCVPLTSSDQGWCHSEVCREDCNTRKVCISKLKV